MVVIPVATPTGVTTKRGGVTHSPIAVAILVLRGARVLMFLVWGGAKQEKTRAPGQPKSPPDKGASRRFPAGHGCCPHGHRHHVARQIGVRGSPERRIFPRVREGEGVRHRDYLLFSAGWVGEGGGRTEEKQTGRKITVTDPRFLAHPGKKTPFGRTPHSDFVLTTQLRP